MLKDHEAVPGTLELLGPMAKTTVRPDGLASGVGVDLVIGTHESTTCEVAQQDHQGDTLVARILMRGGDGVLVDLDAGPMPVRLEVVLDPVSHWVFGPMFTPSIKFRTIIS